VRCALHIPNNEKHHPYPGIDRLIFLLFVGSREQCTVIWEFVGGNFPQRVFPSEKVMGYIPGYHLF
jgi:hypothetical protein